MKPVIQYLGVCQYNETWDAMRQFVAERAADSADEIWIVQHHPVFTLGLAGRSEHVLAPGDIPVIHCDRGGQVTYHGPGQVIAYTMLDLKRLGIGPKALVRRIEQSVIALLASYDIVGVRKPGAPGVYVNGAKIAALGLRIRRGYTYHGVAINVDMDLSPFERIDPCGYAGLEVTQLSKLAAIDSVSVVEHALEKQLRAHIYAPITHVRHHTAA